MEQFFTFLLISSLLSPLLKAMLPKGEASPLFPPLKFLLSLITLLVILSPLFSFLQKGEENFHFSFIGEESLVLSDANREILEKTAENIQDALARTFPDSKFEFSLIADEAGIPLSIEISCEKETEERMKAFLEKNYQIQVNTKKAEE